MSALIAATALTTERRPPPPQQNAPYQAPFGQPYNQQPYQQPYHQSSAAAPQRGTKKNVCSILGLIFSCVTVVFIILINVLTFTAASFEILDFLMFLTVFGTILMWSGLVLSIVGIALQKRYSSLGIAIAALVVSIVVVAANYIINAVLYAALI